MNVGDGLVEVSTVQIVFNIYEAACRNEIVPRYAVGLCDAVMWCIRMELVRARIFTDWPYNFEKISYAVNNAILG